MRQCIEAVTPDLIMHLGDYYEDAEQMRAEYPRIPVCSVPGNCDRYRMTTDAPEILCPSFDGVRFYLTHGHLHGVKMYTDNLIAAAKAAGADIALYGHTHIPECHQQADGFWVLNPGTCGYFGRTAGIVETTKGKIVKCYIINQRFMEAKV